MSFVTWPTPPDDAREQQFWIVWGEKSGTTGIRYYTRSQAFGEAKRLAGETPGENFYVMQAVTRAWSDNPVHTAPVGSNEIPGVML